MTEPESTFAGQNALHYFLRALTARRTRSPRTSRSQPRRDLDGAYEKRHQEKLDHAMRAIGLSEGRTNSWDEDQIQAVLRQANLHGIEPSEIFDRASISAHPNRDEASPSGFRSPGTIDPLAGPSNPIA